MGLLMRGSEPRRSSAVMVGGGARPASPPWPGPPPASPAEPRPHGSRPCPTDREPCGRSPRPSRLPQHCSNPAPHNLPGNPVEQRARGPVCSGQNQESVLGLGIRGAVCSGKRDHSPQHQARTRSRSQEPTEGQAWVTGQPTPQTRRKDGRLPGSCYVCREFGERK